MKWSIIFVNLALAAGSSHILGFLGRSDASDVVSAYSSLATAVVSAGQTSGLDIHVVSSTSASVLLGKVSDARAAYPDASVLFVGHSMTGGAADLQDAVAQEQNVAGVVLLGGFLRRTWRAGVSTCEGTWSVQPTHDCPSGVGLPFCPGGYLPDGVHACSGPEVPTPTYQIPTLTIGGSLDGVVRVSRIAEAWYTQQGSSVHQVALVEGMNHGDVMDIIPDAVNQMDLPSEIGSEAARAAVADLIVGFAAGPEAFQTEALDATFSPFVDMFVKQEGSWWWTSNSDENGSSPWAADAQRRMAEPMPAGFDSWTVSNEFHMLTDESGIPPYYRNKHRPHVSVASNNEVISTTVSQLRYVELTVTGTAVGENGYEIIKEEKAGVLGNGDFVDDGSVHVGAIEIATKIASRQNAWNATGAVDPAASLDDGDRCKTINQAAYDLALSSASPAALARFQAKGRPLVMVADKAPLISGGPWWIWTYMGWNDKGVEGVEVQSIYIFVSLSGLAYGAGNHYCKLLSPARALEWIYTDSLRPLQSKDVVV